MNSDSPNAVLIDDGVNADFDSISPTNQWYIDALNRKCTFIHKEPCSLMNIIKVTKDCLLKPCIQCKHIFCPQAYEWNGYSNVTAPCYLGCCIHKDFWSAFSTRKCFWVFLTICTVLLCAVIFIYSKETILAILTYVETMDPSISFFLFLLLFTIFSFPLTWGYFPLNLAAGYLYGCAAGVFVVCISVTFGIVIAHFLCQLFFTSCIIKLLQRQSNYDQIEAILSIIDGPNGLKIVALTRMTPIPFGFQNGLFAVSYIYATDIS